MDDTAKAEQARKSREVMLRNVRDSAAAQITPEGRANYFSSCEAHLGVLAEVVVVVRNECDTGPAIGI